MKSSHDKYMLSRDNLFGDTIYGCDTLCSDIIVCTGKNFRDVTTGYNPVGLP